MLIEKLQIDNINFKRFKDYYNGNANEKLDSIQVRATYGDIKIKVNIPSEHELEIKEIKKRICNELTNVR